MAMCDWYPWPPAERCAGTVGLLQYVSDQKMTTLEVIHMTDKNNDIMMYQVSIYINLYHFIFIVCVCVLYQVLLFQDYLLATGVCPIGIPELQPQAKR